MKPRHLATNRHLLPLATAIASLLASHSAQAATETWTGATNTWNTSGNWTGTNLPPISGDSLIFGAVGAGGLLLNNDLTSGSFNLAGITFNAGAPAYVIGNGTTTANAGNPFVLTGNVTNSSTSLQTINTPFSMTAARTFNTLNGGGNITLSGDISGTGGGIAKLKSGTLILSGTNSYTGETLLGNFSGEEGAIRANDGVGLPTTSNLNIRVGVFETGTDLVRVGGTSGGQMQLKGGVSNNSANGFSAHGGAVSIAFGTLLSPTALTWGSGVFIPGSQTGGKEGLILNHTTANNTLDFRNAVNLGASVRNVFVNATNATAIATMSGVLSSTGGGLNKKGVGTLVLSGDNTYIGTTTVSAGTLRINGNSSTATGAVSVAAGATLGGTGTVGGATTISGILAPGNSIGTLTIDDNVTWNGVAAVGTTTDWQFELGALNTADLLDITGAGNDFLKNTSAGSLFRFDFLGSTASGTFKLVDWVDTTNFVDGDFSFTNLGGGNTGTFSIIGSQLNFTIIPEPNVAALLGGLGALFLLRRRR